MTEAGVGIFFCVSVERSRGGDLEGRTGRRLLKVGGVCLEKKKLVHREGRTGGDVRNGCVTSTKAPLTSESPDLSTAFNN